MGSVKEMHEADGEDTVEVQPDFELIAFDFVSNPSTHGAFLAPVNEAVKRTAKQIQYNKILQAFNKMCKKIINKDRFGT